MGKINVLDFKVANLIAAGEVVDRPASAVKELTENAIDAGATRITVEIQRGGTRLIRVSDNGCGMSREDVPVALQRHATSKIHSETDLNGIQTLGFRGEALAAIASVSHLRILTRRPEDEMGVTLDSTGGEITSITESGCGVGTTIIVEELFANVPARRKFLKKDTAEAMAVTAVVEKMALSRPDIAIRFLSDGAIRFDTAGDGNLKNAIYAVLGREFARRLIEIKCLTEGIEITGFISSPENVRGNRNYENFFLNGRYVKSACITAALEEAYNSYIPSERFPACVLNLTIHPALVDVNVHPAKLEVKFSSERTVFNAVYCAVRNALTQNIRRPEMELRSDQATRLTGSDVHIVNAFTALDERGEGRSREGATSLFHPLTPEETLRETPRPAEASPVPETPPLPEAPPVPDTPPPPRTTPVPDTPTVTLPELDPAPAVDLPMPAFMQELPIAEEPPPATVSAPEPETPPAPAPLQPLPNGELPELPEEKQIPLPYYRIVGTVFNAYILVELEENRMLMIDKHAAHERILFEHMRRVMRAELGHSYAQLLMLPIELPFSQLEAAVLKEYHTEISGMGLEYSVDVEQRTVSVTAIPAGLSADAASAMLYELAARLSEGTGSVVLARDEYFERALYQASCKAAMKAGRLDDPDHIRWLCEQLLRLPDIKFCPHGRPVAYELTRKELDRQFKRT